MKPLLVEISVKDRINKIIPIIEKIIEIHKPDGVINIESTIESIKAKEYYISLIYIVPPDSEFLTIGKLHMKAEWSKQIRKSIEDFLNIKVIIINTGIKSVNSNIKTY